MDLRPGKVNGARAAGAAKSSGRVDVVDEQAQGAGVAAVEGEREAGQFGVFGVVAFALEGAGKRIRIA
jgi:hypothetical protein